MPHITISKPELYKRLELPADYDEQQFRDLCFAFGVEVEELKTYEDGRDDEFHIEIPANRYDLLCMEGFARAFRYFMGKEPVCHPYRYICPAQPQVMVLKKSILDIRPIVVCGILRNIKFTQQSYNSFIAYQDKLHQNICRKRSLASIGTHDLDSIVGPFSYEGSEPDSFKFTTLRGEHEVDGHGMMEELSKDEHIKEYLPLIRDKPRYPVIYDSKRRVLSVPPIINGAHSKISLETKNVLIEVTATDRTKAHIVLDLICLLFSEYCEKPFEVEQVEIHNEDSGAKFLTPQMTERNVTVSLDYLSKNIGVDIEQNRVCEYLLKLQIPSVLSDDKKSVVVSVPPVRPDIFHPCDIIEDVAIGYGFNKILAIAKAPPTLCHGKQLPINQFSDDLRLQCALGGWTEILTFSLCSEADNFKNLNRDNDGSAVVIGNPKGDDFQNIRVSLFPGLLKTVMYSKAVGLPLKLFELSDICVLDKTSDSGAKNVRALCAFYVNVTSGFEVLHGFFDRIMQVLNCLHQDEFKLWKAKPHQPGSVVYHRYYYIENSEDGVFFPGTCGRIFVGDDRSKLPPVEVGIIGIIHPLVLKAFSVEHPISAFHLNVELLMDNH